MKLSFTFIELLFSSNTYFKNIKTAMEGLPHCLALCCFTDLCIYLFIYLFT